MVDDSHLSPRSNDDLLSIFALEGEYAALFDTRSGREWAALFVADGTYEPRMFATQNNDAILRGRLELSDFCESYEMNVVHLMGLPLVRFAGDQATARIAFSALQSGRTPLTDRSLMTHGYYDVVYHREGGQWRIQSRVSHSLIRVESNFGGAVSPLILPFVAAT